MTDVKRWIQSRMGMVPFSGGDYILAADHDRIVAELRRLLSAKGFFEELKSLQREHGRVLDLLRRMRDERDTLRAEVERLEDRNRELDAVVEQRNAECSWKHKEIERLRIALSHADAWIEAAPHGDNCFVSNHYDGDPGSRCSCGKDSAQEAIELALEASR